MPNYCRYLFKYPSLRLNSVKMCIDQSITKIKKTFCFFYFCKNHLENFILPRFTKSCNLFIIIYVGGLITAACRYCIMQITASDLQFSQCCCCSSLTILKFISLLPQEKYIKVKIKASVKKHILSPSSSNCRTLSIQETFHLDFLN